MLRDIYHTLVEFLRTFGAFQLFFARLILNSPHVLVRRFNLVVQQVFNAGALSLVIIMVCGFFVGGVLGLQGYANLAKFNAEDSVGTFAAFSLIKELGPVITALLFAGRAGTALASEIGLMKATDQLRYGNDGDRPVKKSHRAAIPGRCDINAVAGRNFQRHRIVRCARCGREYAGS